MRRILAAAIGLLLIGSAAPVPAAGRQPGAAATRSLQFATWNFCNHTCPNYDSRVKALTRTIALTRPDVLALQEVDVRGRRLERVAGALAAIGYQNTDPTISDTCPQKCESHIFVDLTKFEVPGRDLAPTLSDRCRNLLTPAFRHAEVDGLRQKIQRIRDEYAGTKPSDTARWQRYQAELDAVHEQQDALTAEIEGCRQQEATVRNYRSPTFGVLHLDGLRSGARGNPAAFAVIRDRRTGATLMAVSLHLYTRSKEGDSNRGRNEAVRGVADWTAQREAQLGLVGLPTFVMGDFNTYERKQPRGPDWTLQRMGFRNADQAKVRVGARYPTVNRMPMDAKWKGFPPRPRKFLAGGPQIDHIMSRGAPRAVKFEVFIRLTKGGHFDERYRASDHNLVRALIPVPVGTTAATASSSTP